MINYLILHLLFIVYALNTVLGRMAAPYGWTDWRRFSLLVLILLYMSSIDRLYFRVVYPTFLIAGLCLLWSDKYRPCLLYTSRCV